MLGNIFPTSVMSLPIFEEFLLPLESELSSSDSSELFSYLMTWRIWILMSKHEALPSRHLMLLNFLMALSQCFRALLAYPSLPFSRVERAKSL